jgi:hypothetical protein
MAPCSERQSGEAAVRSYILRQEAHHEKTCYENELIGLLTKHGVEFDPDTLFD